MNNIASSFRDPSGFIFKSDGNFYRQINQKAQADYDRLMDSGLYQKLIDKSLLIAHEEVENTYTSAYKTIKPTQLSFVSYPYDWSFSQLKDAAYATLRIQKIALKYGMALKDASAFNIQFVKNKPVLIDTLSLECYNEGEPWIAYKQFCQHFLAPLALMSYKDIRISKLSSVFIDGIPLDMASTLLPYKTKFNFSIASHIHWHAKTQLKHADGKVDTKKKAKISKTGMLGIISNLQSIVKKLQWKMNDTEWGDYYNNTNYSDDAFEAKKALVTSFIEETNAHTLWDLGANDGTFSGLAADLGIDTLAFDIEPVAVEKNYLRLKKTDSKMTPLLIDLTNPSGGLGWANKERDTLQDRGKTDCVMALALIHHLSISNNVPLDMLAEYFASLGNYLIIEFVPKGDSKVDILLTTREDIFPNYTLEGFEASFSNFFTLVKKEPVAGSKRTLYLYKTK